MKILFLQDNIINESLALCDLAGILKVNNIAYDLLIEKEERNFTAKISAFNADLTIIPISVIKPAWGLKTAQVVKKITPDSKVVIAGTYATFYPEIIENKNIDIVLIGEAEGPILSLVEKLKNNSDYSKINNLWIKYNDGIIKNSLGPLTDLSSLPLPDREIYYKYKTIKNFPLKLLSTGRGCPNNCSYCFNPALKIMLTDNSIFTRKKPVNNLINEINYLLSKRYPLTHIHFSDDLFTYDKNWVIEFGKMYRSVAKVPFTINSKVEYLDEEIVASLKNAGCHGIAIGLETANEQLRNVIMNKNTTNSKIIEAAKIIKKHDIVLTTFNMIDLPQESLADVFKTIQLNQNIEADNPRVRKYLPIPKTKLAELMEQHKNDISRSLPEKESLIILFPILVNFPWLNSFLSRHIWFLQIFKPVWHLFEFIKLINEKKFFNISILKSIPYYLHTGGPQNKTTVYSTIL